ncbi:MAG: hypothetical protein AAF196_03440 [Planctomycetota bacterium]
MRRFVDSIMFLLVAYTVGLPFVRSVLGSEPENVHPTATISTPATENGDVVVHEASGVTIADSDIHVGVLVAEQRASGDHPAEANVKDDEDPELVEDATSTPLMQLIPATRIR